jgi:hypothetical protein
MPDSQGFKEELTHFLNKDSLEGGADTPDSRDALCLHVAQLDAHVQRLAALLSLFPDLHSPRSASVPKDDPQDVPAPKSLLEAPGGLLGACLGLLQRFVDLNDGPQPEGFNFFEELDALAEDCRALLVQTEGLPRLEDSYMRYHIEPDGTT